MPAGVELQLRPVIVVRGPYRANDGQVIRATANVWQPVADFQAALPVPFEANLQRKQLVSDMAVRVVGHHHAQIVVDERGGQHVAVRGIANLLAGEFIERRLWQSKLSIWLMPPTRKIQMTLRADARCSLRFAG